MKISPEMARCANFIRGFIRPWPARAAELSALFMLLALEQAERATTESGEVLTLDLWLEAARQLWQWRHTN